ncbi:hypothetical protein HZC09_01170 [Candidatus Micrarchaeota archaeon]|nr:hypothetical protein [Candidatus Micrarchaeota archaeon]
MLLEKVEGSVKKGRAQGKAKAREAKLGKATPGLAESGMAGTGKAKQGSMAPENAKSWKDGVTANTASASHTAHAASSASSSGMSDEEAELKGFCKKCGKAYGDEELKTEINLAQDGWFEDYTLRCPKGHVIYFKD